MKVTVTEDGYIDFEAPIRMTEGQKEKFVKFMKRIFPTINMKEVNEPIKQMPLGRKSESRDWDNVDEFSLLLGPESNESIAEKTGRSSMSIRMKRGDFVPEFMVWAKKKGYTYSPKNVDKKVVKEFMIERGLK